MSRVVVDATAARTGGGPSRVRELLKAFPALAPSHRFAFYLQSDLAREITAPAQTTVSTVPRGARTLPARLFWEHLVLPFHVRSEEPDWVLSPFNVLPLGPGLPQSVCKAVIVSNIAPFIPEMWRAEGRYQTLRNRLLQKLTLLSLDRADQIFFLSNHARSMIGSGLPSDRVTVLPMAPPNPEVIARLDQIAFSNPLPSHLFVIAGTLYPYKGIEDAVLAAIELRRKGLGVALWIFGQPLHRRYTEELTRLAHTAPTGAVTFIHFGKQDAVMSAMKASKATIICSRVENMSRVPVEAMSVGSPVISTDIPSTREACGDAALYYEPGDVSGLARCMERVVGDDVRADLVERGRRRISGLDWLSASRDILRTLDLLG